MIFVLVRFSLLKKTCQQVIKPMKSHRFDIKSLENTTFSTHVVVHFNSSHRSTKHFTFNA